MSKGHSDVDGEGRGASRVLIVNPAAGGEAEADEVLAAVRGEGQDVALRATQKAGDARRFAREAATSGAAELWVAGGDGTLHEAVLGLRDAGELRGTVLHPVPLGTGNDLIRSVRIPLDWKDAVQALGRSRRTLELDVMEVEVDGEALVAINAVVAGNGGRIGEVLDAEGKSWWGPLAYLRAAAEVAMELESVAVTIRVDDGPERRQRILNVVAANGRYAGKGIPIAPGARPDDGTLDVVTMGEATLPHVLGMMQTLLREEDPDHEAYRHERVRSMTIEADETLPVSVDGENTEAHTVRITLAPERIPVRVPSEEGTEEDG